MQYQSCYYLPLGAWVVVVVVAGVADPEAELSEAAAAEDEAAAEPDPAWALEAPTVELQTKVHTNLHNHWEGTYYAKRAVSRRELGTPMQRS